LCSRHTLSLIQPIAPLPRTCRLDASQPAASVVFTDPRERPFGIAPGVGSVTAAAAASAATVDTHTKVTNALLR